MVKPRGPVCNLACDYCYYLPKTGLYPDSDFRMSRDLLENFTQQMISAHPNGEVSFSWQGGEPTLMGLDFFKEAVRLQKEICPPGMRVTNLIQTNGTTLTPAWSRFFKQHNFLVGLSLDGPPELHNLYRHDRSGRGTFRQAARAVKLLQQHAVDFNILCCVHRGNQDHPLSVYRFFRDALRIKFIQFIPILQRKLDSQGFERDEITRCSVQSEAYGRFLTTIFDEWVRKDVGQVFIQIYDLALGAWLGAPPSLCVFAETCGRALALEHNGDLYACDHFVDPQHLLGNITQKKLLDMVNSTSQGQFGRNKQEKASATCRECPFWFACHGGCPKNRDSQGLNRLCTGYQFFFEHITPFMQQMADLVRQGQPAADIMEK